MKRKTIVISANASWNILNFRLDLISALQQRGYRVIVLAPEDRFSGQLDALSVDFVPIHIDRQGVSPINDLLLLARYRRALAKICPDLFLGYTVKPNIYGSLAARTLGIKVINNISGLGTAFISEGILTRIVTALYKLALRHSATVFFQNRDDMDLFLGAKIVRPEQAALLPGSGIDLTRFAPASRSSKDHRVRFLYLGRLLWDKGVREYVDAARLVRAKRPKTVFQLLGFVDVPNRTAVARSDIDAWVEEGIVEYLPACDDVRPHIAGADCVVLPSYREGLPRSLLEAAAMARPLIATDVPGCRDAVDHGINGLLCAVRDPHSLADAITKMVDLTVEERAGMGSAGRRKVEANFDHAIVIERCLEAIDHVLGIAPPRSIG
jgi:glycosyltransferase involved in cell wall biosynthesis